MQLLIWQKWFINVLSLRVFLAELIAIFIYFILSERVRGGRSEPPDGKSNEKSQSPSLLWAHGKTFRYGKAHL